MKFLPLVLANFLFFMSISEAGAPEKNLTINHTETKSISQVKNFQDEDDTEISDENILRLTWDVVPFAVKYRVTYEGTEDISYTTGIEISVQSVDSDFHVTALNFDNEIVKDDVRIISAETNPKNPLTTSEFDKMNFAPLYLVYSWIPVKDAHHYEIQLLKNNSVVRDFITVFNPKDDEFDFYDDTPLFEEGEYFWRVRGISANNVPITDWSAKNPGNRFSVIKSARFCALGDSITHGGGAISVPPSSVIYNWEYYCMMPIKNLGKSGDTTEQMLNRFERDVVTFHPEVLFILAGVNDYRSGIGGWRSVQNLKKIKEKCDWYGIIPVFITPTPINPDLIRKVKFVERPPADWREHRKYICDWILQQEYHIDISEEFTDEDGNLIYDLSLDGVHPDAEGKQIIGRAVEDWLTNYLKY